MLACSFRSTSGDTYSAVPTNDRFLLSAVNTAQVSENVIPIARTCEMYPLAPQPVRE